MSTTVTQTIQFSKETLLKSVPAEAFQKHDSAALRVIARVVISVALSYTFLIWAPAYLVPVAWIVVGTALSGLITIAHDCGHNAFFESDSKNQLAGTLAFLPLLYPLESWKLHHNAHHKHAEERSNAGHQQKPKKLLNPLLWPLYVGSYLLRYFDLSQFSKEQQARSRTSVLAVYAYALVSFSALFYFAGAWGIVKYWAMPWLVVHFWKNTLRTYLMGVIDWKNQQLVHYKYPAWVEFLCYDANYLIPHYLSTQIPTYNCRAVHEKLRASEWGQYIVIRSWFKLLEDQDKDKSSRGQRVREPKKFKLIPLLRNLNWLHIPLLVGLPIAGFYGLFTLPFYHPYTLAFAFAYYLFSGLGITAGYHRLWAHRAYEAALPFRLFLMLGGTAAVEGSIRWWCRDHRAHHRYTDTTKDPYSAKEGFWYAHMGWMLVKQNPKNIGFADISDLNADPMIRWQHRNYLPFAFFMSFGLPALVCGLGWGDFWGGFYLAGILRLVFVHHATFFVNSLAHTMGSHTYSDKHTPRDSIITALLTFGEGYHNFHHEFPNDYRNGIKFYHYDPTKWLIRSMAFFGMAYDLKEFPDNEIQKGVAQMVQKKVDTIRAKLQWGPEVSSLPLWSEEDLQKAQENGKKVVIIDGVVHDVTVFVNNHPGGNIIKSYLGTDATAAFYGGVYDHSNAAINLLATLRLARYSGPLAIPSSPATEKKEH